MAKALVTNLVRQKRMAQKIPVVAGFQLGSVSDVGRFNSWAGLIVCALVICGENFPICRGIPI